MSQHLVDELTYMCYKRVHEKRVLGIEVPYFGYIPHIGLCYVIGFLGSFRWISWVAHLL
jgi:hypothetical protein